MSKWVLVFLCCVTSNAFASPADSGRCPWKIPFTLKIQGRGIVNWRNFIHTPDSTSDSSGSELSTSIDYQFIKVDTSQPDSAGIYRFTKYAVENDTLRYSLLSEGMYWGNQSEILVVAFAQGRDSIASLSYVLNGTYSPHPALGQSMEEDTFAMAGLHFDDTSIFVTDSSMSEHKVEWATHRTEVQYWDPPSTGYGWWIYSNFTATSVDLSGIFRPTHFADQAAVAVAPPSANGLEITASGGALHCSFGAATEGRWLEVYSPLGVCIANYPVPAGATEAQTKLVAAGLYFVRLEGALTKIYVPD